MFVNDLRLAVAEAIRRVRHQVAWKPGKDLIHFKKRQALGHLGATTTLDDYNRLIQAVVEDPRPRVYVYRARGSVYAAVRGNLDRPWLTIFSLAGIMEAAFPPDDIEGYLAQAGFTEMGTVEELLR